jgi:hypothetical protein
MSLRCRLRCAERYCESGSAGAGPQGEGGSAACGCVGSAGCPASGG